MADTAQNYIMEDSPGQPKQTIQQQKTYITEHSLCECTPVARYAPEFVDTELDVPTDIISTQYFEFFENMRKGVDSIQDILLAH